MKEKLTSENFVAQHREKETDFTRERSLPFCSVVLFLCGLLRSCLDTELAKFVRAVTAADIPVDVVSGSAFSHARKKLKSSAFVELNRHIGDWCMANTKLELWGGYRLVAVDGTTLRLPRSPAVAEHFGGMDARQGPSRPMARASQMFDPLNGLTLDAQIAPYNISERELIVKHLQHLPERALVLLDRGYPAAWLFALLRSKGAHFCARLKAGQWKCTRQFLNSGLAEQIVQLPIGWQARRKCETLGLPIDPIEVRLIRVELNTGEVEVLATSLVASDTPTQAQMAKLYTLRWPVEEDYKLIKSRMEVENFSGRTVRSIYQDFHAAIFTKNLVCLLSDPVREKITEVTQDRRHTYKMNWTRALATFRDCGLCLFFRDAIDELLESLHRLLLKALTVVRPGRSFPRPKSYARKNYALGYKPIS